MLLDEIKDYVRMDGNDQDAIVNSAILRGQARIEGLVGAALDFESEGLPKSLLFDFCRYSLNNASEYFEENFQQEILRLQLQTAVGELESEEQS